MTIIFVLLEHHLMRRELFAFGCRMLNYLDFARLLGLTQDVLFIFNFAINVIKTLSSSIMYYNDICIPKKIILPALKVELPIELVPFY